MKYPIINNQLFVENRKKFVSKMKPNSMAIFVSNYEQPFSADLPFKYRHNSDLFYLSGVDQEETILILFPDCPDEKMREMLFIRETSEEIRIWEGYKHTKELASKISGLPEDNIHWNVGFEKTLRTLMTLAENVYLNTNEHTRYALGLKNKNEDFAKELMDRYPVHNYQRSAPILADLRACKHEVEVELIKKACEITGKAFERVCKFVKPGVNEYEIEAEIMHEFLKNGANGPAYPNIIASGADSCVLHYMTNDKQCEDGGVLLMDFGCEYANYASDMTRTIPVNGKFTDRQKQVYEAVLRVQKAAADFLVPGKTINEYHKEVGAIVEEELINLDLLDKDEVKSQDPKKPLYKKYFMHGTSHFLGIDVHDVGDFFAPIKEGMVFTVEPGIYIPEEEIGIRIENNIFITSNGHIDLMGHIPREVEEIEGIMAS